MNKEVSFLLEKIDSLKETFKKTPLNESQEKQLWGKI